MTNKQLGDMFVVSSGKRVALMALALSFLFSVTAFAATSSVYDLTVIDGEDSYAISTYKTDATEILSQTAITLFDGDELDTSEFTGVSGSVITVNRGVKVTVVAEDLEAHIFNVYGTVADALEKAQIELDLDNVVSNGLKEALSDGMVINVYKKCSVTATADGTEYTDTVTGNTVADALAALGVELGEDDYSEPDAEKLLTDGMNITVYRVTYSTDTVTERIPYETEYKTDDTQYVTSTRVQSKGSRGTKEVTYRYRYVDGELESENAVSETIVKEAVNRVVVQGTKPLEARAEGFSSTNGYPISEMAVPSYVNIGANGLPTEYEGCIQAQATAYCIPGGTTSTGKRAQTGYVAVDPNEIPYGTEMYIVSADGQYVYGYCVAADTGGYIYDVDWTVDLYMNSTSQCLQWGRRDIVIYFL